MVWSLLLIAGSEGPTLISLAASHLHTVGVFAAHVVPQFEFRDLFGLAVTGIAVEPSGPSKWAVAGEIWKGRQITTLNVRSLLHPRRTVLNVLTNLGPAAREMPCLHLP